MRVLYLLAALALALPLPLVRDSGPPPGLHAQHAAAVSPGAAPTPGAVDRKPVSVAAGLGALALTPVSAATSAQNVTIETCDGPPPELSGNRVNPGSTLQSDTLVKHDGAASWRLHYEFEDDPAAAVNGAQYLVVTLNRTLNTVPQWVRFWFKGDGSANVLRLRCADATGEQFQYVLGDCSDTTWHELTCDFRGQHSHTGGDNNDRFDGDLTLRGLALDCARPSRGDIWFDQLSVQIGATTAEPAAEPATDTGVDPAINAFGMCVHLWTGTRDTARTLKLAREVGARWIRDECPWAKVEPRRGLYEFPAPVDDYLRTARGLGMEPVVVLDYGNPNYDEGRPPVTDAAQDGFARYCYQMVNHYKNLCHYWEIYNEPNLLIFWRPKPDPVAYARLLKKAYTACKQADPNCVVLGVAGARIDLVYIEQVLREGAGDYMDALSLHPYCRPHAPEKYEVVPQLQRCHDLMAKYGQGHKRIWATEFGWPNVRGPRTNTEEETANYIARQVSLMRALPFMGPAFYHDLQNDGTSETEMQHTYGLVRADFTPKRQFFATKAMGQALDGKSFLRALPVATPVYAHEYQNAAGEHALVLWSTPRATKVTVQLDTDQVEVLQITGTSQRATLRGGRLTLNLGESPLFVVGRFTTATVR